MYCKHCGSEIDDDVIICPKCGKQVQELRTSQAVQEQPNIIINNTASANAVNAGQGNAKKKSKAILLCCIGFLGIGGLHKFYEGKSITGIIYLFTGGLFLIGTILDLIALLGKPDIYYV